MRRLLLLCCLSTPAMAEAPYDAFAESIVPCYEAATSDAEVEACYGTAAQACMQGAPDGETTYGMMECLLSEASAWDTLLNREYQRARAFARGLDDDEADSSMASAREETLRDAQRAWIAFRDANCAMEYALWGAGSMRMIAGADCTNRMTHQRVMDLRHYGQEP
ncbi:lysozyme inhibitor LprI family protein [Pararhodobacter sp. CCB-MM2]|uniref:lysozyme inhibitor LprI family protein n=1 Tax=Pararhodobacter sp. CCB-MM2 TaxID=1786003 RepID=UPI0008372991|nr:lysozyme inhibitor LprI family protein [Pararhodobacter sp. CCB-MM2]